MKQFKKFIVMLLCVCAVTGLTACGSNKDNTTTNEATDGTKKEGVVDEIGNDMKEDVNEMKNDVKNGVDNTVDENKTDVNTMDKETESGKQ